MKREEGGRGETKRGVRVRESESERERWTLLSPVWVSNGHLAWRLVHEAVRLSICQNEPIAVLTLKHTHTHTHTLSFPLCLSATGKWECRIRGSGVVTWRSIRAYRSLSLWGLICGHMDWQLRGWGICICFYILTITGKKSLYQWQPYVYEAKQREYMFFKIVKDALPNVDVSDEKKHEWTNEWFHTRAGFLFIEWLVVCFKWPHNRLHLE